MVEYKITSENPTIEGQADMVLAAVIVGDEVGTRITGSGSSEEILHALAHLLSDMAMATGLKHRLLSWVNALAISSLEDKLDEAGQE